MNILLLNWRDPDNPRSGGAEYVTHEHAKGWVKNGDKVTWFSTVFPRAKSETVLDGVCVVRRGNAFSVFWHAAFYYFSHKNEIDIVIDQVHGVPFFAALYVRKPVILFIHEVAGNIWERMFFAPIGWIGKMLEHLFLFVYRNHIVWTDAPSTVRELVGLGMNPRLCRAIPCPIAFAPARSKPNKNPELTTVFVGRIVRMKRVEDILMAFSDIHSAVHRATLCIVGDGDQSYITELKKLARSLHINDAVIWTGKVSEKRKKEFLARSHILLHTSVKEGWGLVILEAGSQWTPSVVYGVGGLIDTVKDGKTGIIVPSCEPHDLANAALSLYADRNKFEVMQKQAMIWSSRFHWSDAIKESRALITQAYETYYR